jgi:lipopolysaccharide export system protein LptA
MFRLPRTAFVAIAALASLGAAQAQIGTTQIVRPLPAPDLKIDADGISVDDMSATATFTGNVRIAQGDAEWKCRKAVAHYNVTPPTGISGIDHIDCEP